MRKLSSYADYEFMLRLNDTCYCSKLTRFNERASIECEYAICAEQHGDYIKADALRNGAEFVATVYPDEQRVKSMSREAFNSALQTNARECIFYNCLPEKLEQHWKERANIFLQYADYLDENPNIAYNDREAPLYRKLAFQLLGDEASLKELERCKADATSAMKQPASTL